MSFHNIIHTPGRFLSGETLTCPVYEYLFVLLYLYITQMYLNVDSHYTHQSLTNVKSLLFVKNNYSLSNYSVSRTSYTDGYTFGHEYVFTNAL